MTLDEAIKNAEKVVEEQKELYRLCPASESDIFHCDGTKNCKALKNGKNKGCQRCAEEYRQLAEWLKELKQLREQITWMKDWTKCSSDNLPDMNVDVLGTTKDYSDVVKVTRMKTYLGDAGWEWVLTDDIEGNSYNPDEIIAWMPLPEPYKEESEDIK